MDLHNQVRAMDPWPGAFTTWHGATLKALRSVALPASAEGRGVPQGTVVALAGGPAPGWGRQLATAHLGIMELQLEGRRAADAASFLRGHTDFIGARLPS